MSPTTLLRVATVAAVRTAVGEEPKCHSGEDHERGQHHRTPGYRWDHRGCGAVGWRHGPSIQGEPPDGAGHGWPAAAACGRGRACGTTTTTGTRVRADTASDPRAYMWT